LTNFDSLMKPIKFILDVPPSTSTPQAVHHFQQQIKTKLDSVLELIYIVEGKKKIVEWKVKRSDLFVIISGDLRALFKLFHDVLTQWDYQPYNYYSLPETMDFTHRNNFTLIVVPFQYNCQKFVIKEASEKINIPTLLERYDYRVPRDIVSMVLGGKNLRLFLPERNYRFVVIHNKAFHLAMHHKHAGSMNVRNVGYYWTKLEENMQEEWSVFLHTLDDIGAENDLFPHLILLEPQIFQMRKQVVDYLNQKLKGVAIHFTLTSKDHLQVLIGQESISIEIDNNLRDIFAFDTNVMKGAGVFTASDSLSLTRRIQFLYIYSSISDSIRVGDTEAPLLAITPFALKSGVTEKDFYNPLYTRVTQNRISQIDIGIYDGAGQRVPFPRGSITSLRLHFRQV